MFIEVKLVSKFYQKFKAVDDLSLTVDQGDIYGFLGPNGSGKSTTIRMILSLIKPSSGEIKLFGDPVGFRHNSGLNRIGALVEKPDFYNYLTAHKNLEILGKLSGVQELSKRIDEVLDMVGLLSRAESKVKTYSQGMKERLGIAQTLLHKPELIILDEPTNGLDPQGQKEIRELVISLTHDLGITILISSHILYEIEQIANRMIIINKGKSLVEGKVKDLLKEREQQVVVDVSENKKAFQIMKESAWAEKLRMKDDGRIATRITREQTPVFIRYMMDKGIDVYSIEPVRSLEDYFLHITEDETAN